MIVTLDIIKQEVGRLDDFHDDMLTRKVDEAEAIVIDYLKVAATTYQDTDGNNDFPPVIASSVIAVARTLYEKPEDDPLSDGVKNILHRLRDPALA